MTTCKAPQCDKKMYTAKTGLCRGHYERHRKGTEVNTPLKVHDSSQGCKADRCEEKHYSLGYCQLHSQRFRRGADLYRKYRLIDGSQGCCVESCNKKHYGKGFCVNHFQRITRTSRKQQFIKEMGGKCLDCGADGLRPECYDFDNVTDEPGHVQIATLLNHNAPDERVQEELKRCELVCANCHRTRTNIRQYGLMKVRLGMQNMDTDTFALLWKSSKT